jgi:hypothetical protein
LWCFRPVRARTMIPFLLVVVVLSGLCVPSYYRPFTGRGTPAKQRVKGTLCLLMPLNLTGRSFPYHVAAVLTIPDRPHQPDKDKDK